MLCRKHGAELCYTPMINSKVFCNEGNQAYREEVFSTVPEDRPLITQFCGNDPEVLLKAARLVEDRCDAIDLNLGCPQGIARRGHYGSFLQDDWELIERIVRTLHRELKIPVTCKIRIFPDVEKSISYAKMIESAGCQLLTVHGRTRDQKGQATGLADWEQIRRIKAAVSIPVFANGNIRYHDDVHRCLAYTGCDGVMSAEGNLQNPAIFTPTVWPAWRMAGDYLELCKVYATPLSYIRAHLFCLYKRIFYRHTDMREALATAHSFADIQGMHQTLSERLRGESSFASDHFALLDDFPLEDGERKIPDFYCQPFVRTDRLLHIQKEAAGGVDACRHTLEAADGLPCKKQKVEPACTGCG